jgi:hypothetical protein
MRTIQWSQLFAGQGLVCYVHCAGWMDQTYVGNQWRWSSHLLLLLRRRRPLLLLLLLRRQRRPLLW